jgi:GNAT superfamily N-acetyltransferase
MLEISVAAASPGVHAEISALYAGCGYERGFTPQDTLLIARLDLRLVGAVRLCPEHGLTVLRGMQVAPEVRRRGIGIALLRACDAKLGDATCYCVPWRHLEPFYGAIGFRSCEPQEASHWLGERLRAYRRGGHDVILMVRRGTQPARSAVAQAD